MRRRWGLVAGGVAAVLVAAGLVVGLTRGGGEKDAARIVGGPELAGTTAAPDLSGPELASGKTIRIADLKGTPVIVNLWASWCGPCREEAPDIKRFTEERDDVAVIGIDVNNERGDATAFAKEVAWTHPSIYDPDGDLADRLEIVTLPTTVYIDRAGTLRGSTPGTVTYDDLVSVAERLK